ncbi:GAF domain-containing protein [Serinibacter salmoneus]|uniref:GAF domain-containing protein n=1 Tax=Serinibacter salmoneus TaxID=556530 RepID=A0A2A9CYG6_9MICO|nr:GAF domain-containing protein [Serinibacter salmoneus]PFG19181.1 hypothetical protein ATL40_0738 [Serinibacter salmoneus]
MLTSTQLTARQMVWMRRAHERFLTRGEVAPRVRSAVAASWERSARVGVDPDAPTPPVDLSEQDVAALRRDHPLAWAIPIARTLLLEPDAGWVAALTDTAGRLLWVEGNGAARRDLETVGFTEGATWREDCTGTNAPGTALATDSAVRVLGAEHWATPIHGWNCAAAPVHGPTGQVLGVLDITGADPVASPLAASLLRATVATIEARMLAASLATPSRTGTGTDADARSELGTGSGSAAEPGAPTARLQVLAHRRALRLPDGERTLSPRHAEIVLLLAEHPEGMTAEEVAVALAEHDLSVVTVRAEVSRLRRVAPDLLREGSPYRLRGAVRTDVAAVRQSLRAGDLAGALATYPGPVLPASRAPGVETIREALEGDLRAAVLASTDPHAVARWTASDSGREDWWAWHHLGQIAAPGSALAQRARAEVARLDLSQA